MENLLKLAEQMGFEIYLFGSRLKGRGADIDLVVKGRQKPSLKQIVALSTAFHKFADTKVDLVPWCKETQTFISYIAGQD